jgi:hypothetical protein
MRGRLLPSPVTGRLYVVLSALSTGVAASAKEMQRKDAASGRAELLRKVGEKVAVFSFSHNPVEVPARRGFACPLANF